MTTFGIYSPSDLPFKDAIAPSRSRNSLMNVHRLIGVIPLELLDFVVTPKSQKLIGNPEHGGEYMFDMLPTIRRRLIINAIPACFELASCLTQASTSSYDFVSGGGAPSEWRGRLWRSARRSGVTPGTMVTGSFRRVRSVRCSRTTPHAGQDGLEPPPLLR